LAKTESSSSKKPEEPPLDNPLSKFFPVEDREDGVYIRVTREVSAAVGVERIIAELDRAMVTNYDVQAIRDVLTRARGGFEKIGPPFDYYNPEMDKYVDLSVTPLKAGMVFSSVAIANDIKPTASTLAFCLKRKGIVFGLKQDVLRDVAQNGVYDKEVVIAEGLEPVAGQDAKIVFEVDLEKDARPIEERGGKVDYRNIHSIAQIGQGKAIARKEAATAGTPGKDVRGDEIPATPGKDTAIKAGKNTMMSEDGKYLLATKSGYVYKQGDLVNVGELLTIKSDVDFSVGNIKYSGDVEIFGNVLSGFTVETEGNIHIKGEAESAKIISRNGSVTIEKGIIGKGDMIVSAKHDVGIVFAQAAVVTSEAAVTIEKYCLHCDVTCDTAVGADSHAAFIGGSLTAFSKVEIGVTGNDKGVETKIFVFDKEELAINEKLRELSILERKLNADLDPIKKQLRTKAAILKQAGTQASPRQTEELKKWLDVYNKLAVKLKYVQEKTAGLQADLKKPRQYGGYIKISGDVYPGTELNLYGMSKVIKAHLVNKMFHVRDGAVVVEG
jgi:hypothetical protein